MDTAHEERNDLMDNFIIETKGLTKYYGETAAVKGVDLHVKKVKSMPFWEGTEPERQQS